MSERFRAPAEDRADQIGRINNISFVRWDGIYKNHHSKAICRCDIDGHEWSASVSNLLSHGTGCPSCAEYGFNPARQGYLYALRSDCGSMVKIGISNTYKTRLENLKRKTPFGWECIEVIKGSGIAVAEAEKELHAVTERAIFINQFDGFTEWRKWDSKIPELLSAYRMIIEAH